MEIYLKERAKGIRVLPCCCPFLWHLAELTPMNNDMPGALGWLLFMLHLQGLLCDDREGVFPNEMLATSLNSVPLVLQGQASLEPDTNRAGPLLLRTQPGSNTSSLDGAKTQSRLSLPFDLEGMGILKSFWGWHCCGVA